tara:strand:- start:7 stop:117 length:111 start_codon:yes stop_codon:yes gene_type:complete
MRANKDDAFDLFQVEEDLGDTPNKEEFWSNDDEDDD